MLLFSGVFFFVSGIRVLQVVRDIDTATGSLDIIYLSAHDPPQAQNRQPTGIWRSGPGGVRWIVWFGQFGEGDMIFSKPLVDVFSI